MNDGHINHNMCDYKKHLISLAMFFTLEVMNNRFIFNEIHNFCKEVNHRYELDKDLQEFIENNSYLSFIEAKRIYDSGNKKY